MSVFNELRWRELIFDASEGVEEHLSRDRVTLYIGFDPTAASLHVGSLLHLVNLARMQRFGHVPIALAGGGTGLIGDPSGKSKERDMITAEQVEENLVGIRAQLAMLLDFDTKTNPAKLVDNATWLTRVKMIDFLRDIGKHFTVNYMLAKESVDRRLKQEEGISYTEFSYLLLQSYDFLVLHRDHGCTLQMGGSDQWGNITAGTELIRKLRRQKAYGLVTPLVTTSSGVKFGKTEAGAVWLDGKMTSPYRFYQFWLNTADSDVVKYLRFFTFLESQEIDELAASMAANPGRREAQKRLASEVTTMIHGPTAHDRALRSSQVLFGGELEDLEPDEILDIFDDVPSSQLPRRGFEGPGMALPDLLATCGLVESKGAARRLLREGGVYLNNRRATADQTHADLGDFLDGRILVLRKGQKKYHLLTLLES